MRPRGDSARSDRGSALVELVAVGLVLLLPLVHLVVVVSRVQAASFAVEAAARAAARAHTTGVDPSAGAGFALAQVRTALRDQGFDVGAAGAEAATRVVCESSPCGLPGTRVTVTVTYEVQLPGVPAVLDSAMPTRVPVTGESTAVADQFAPGAVS